jgi:membrane protease subunit (stomatin/prohibitin family)
MRIVDPAKFILTVVGTSGDFTTETILGQLRNIAVTRFSDALAESKIAALDMASNLNEFSTFCEQKLQSDFTEYGIQLSKFLVVSITLPEEVEKVLDKRTSMGIVGDMNKYMQFQAAQSMEAAANNPADGGASAGMGMGMGFGMANMMLNNLNQQQQQNQGANTPPPIPGQLKYHVAVNGQPTGPYDMTALQQMISQGQLTSESLVWKEGMPGWQTAGTVLASLFGQVPPPIPQA